MPQESPREMSSQSLHQSGEQKKERPGYDMQSGNGSQKLDVKKTQMSAEMYSLDLDADAEKNRKLFAVAYSSELQVPNGQNGADLLEEIFKVAVKNNLAHRIGGTLSYNEKTHTVHQYIEGPKENVLRLLDSITADQRHIVGKIYTKHQISSRRFSSFGMMWASDDAAPFLWDGLRSKGRNSSACSLQ